MQDGNQYIQVQASKKVKHLEQLSQAQEIYLLYKQRQLKTMM